MKITEEGEIISKSPSVFLGYYKNPEATEKTLQDGWLYSGDKGFIDEDGHLVVFDRSKDVMILQDKSIFAPQYLETRLKFAPFIKDAWVIGHERPYITAVVCIDYAVVGKWADDKKINYTSYHELSQKPEVYDLVEKQIREANRSLKKPAKVHKFLNLYKEFDADDEELTRTRKLRRAFVENRYKMLVEALYQDTDSVHMDTTITYEDGRVSQIKTDLHIRKYTHRGGEVMQLFLQALITGIMMGGIYALVALGWTLIYKCSGVLNLAMGELTLIGAYVSLTLYLWGIPFLLALLLTIIIGFILGLITERLFLDKLIGEPVLTVIMVTVGLSFFFRGIIVFIFGTDTVIFDPPVFPMKPIDFGGIIIGQVYLWSFIAAIVLLLVFVAFFQYTRWGLSMQATADDEMAALSLGVSARFVYAIAWGIAFVAAGVGGTLLSNINGLNISVGYLGLLVLPAVVLGGLNSVPGAIVGGIIIGVLQNLSGTYLDRFFPGGVKEIAPFIFMVIILFYKPFGLWGWERIERV